MYSSIAFDMHLLDEPEDRELPEVVAACQDTGRPEKTLFSQLEVCKQEA